MSSWGNATFGYGNWEWDPNSYREVVNAPAPSGSVESVWEDIITLTNDNCTASAITWNASFQKTDSESISHTASGELKTEVALKVGQKDVSEVGLAHAQVQANQWQYAGNWSHVVTDGQTVTIPACSGKKVLFRGKYRLGDHSGSGHIDFFVRTRVSFDEWRDSTGECAQTTSQARGNKRYIALASRITDTTPLCDKSTPCGKKKCEEPQL